jgi:hypothetical protein
MIKCYSVRTHRPSAKKNNFLLAFLNNKFKKKTVYNATEYLDRKGVVLIKKNYHFKKLSTRTVYLYVYKLKDCAKILTLIFPNVLIAQVAQ